MFLTRLILNLGNPLVIRDLKNAHEMHRTLMSLFPDTPVESPRAHYGVVHRIMPLGQKVAVLLQSHVQPNVAGLPEGYAESVNTREISALPDRVAVAGATYTVNVLLNPTVNRTNGGRETIHDPEQQLIWAGDLAARNGFRLLEATLVAHQPVLMNRESRWVLLRGAVLTGLIEVVDEERFREAVRNGVGRARSYGFGLLQLGLV